MPDETASASNAEARNASTGLKAYLDDVADVVRRVPAAWVRCELHALKPTDGYARMEFIEIDRHGKQIAKVQGSCRTGVWRRIDAEFRAAGLMLEAGSQVLVKLEGSLHSTFGFQVSVLDVDLTFALGDLNARMQAIRKQLQYAGVWNGNRSLPKPTDFVRVSVIAPAGAAGLGDFRATADRLAAAGLAEFAYHEVPFQTRDGPARIVEVLRSIYRANVRDEERHCAVAIIRGGGASADLAWLVDHKLAEAVCKMNIPVMTGIGHERDRTLLDEVACISCDTPSKVVEHIRATITRAALDGQRARESIGADAARIAARHEARLASARNLVDRDARESVRLAEDKVRAAAAGLQPGARGLLDDAQGAVASSRTRLDRGAVDVLRLAERTVRSAATGLEPGARALLDGWRTAVAAALEGTNAAARRRTEIASLGTRDLRRSIAFDADASVRPIEQGMGRAVIEIGARLEELPQRASEGLARVRRELAEDVERSSTSIGDEVAHLGRQATQDAMRSLERCDAEIAAVLLLAEALHPQNVLAAGYAILRDPSGSPLTGATAVRTAGTVTAELRDGEAVLTNIIIDQQEEVSR